MVHRRISRVTFNICGSGAPGPCAAPVPFAALGVAGDMPVPGDYDGDGNADAAVDSLSPGDDDRSSTNPPTRTTRQLGIERRRAVRRRAIPTVTGNPISRCIARQPANGTC